MIYARQCIRGIFLSCLILVSAICSTNQPDAKQNQEKEKIASGVASLTDDPRLVNLIAEFNAVTDWSIGSTFFYGLQPVYTYETQRFLIREDKRPVLVLGRVDDLLFEGGYPVVQLRVVSPQDPLSMWNVPSQPYLRFILTCRVDHFKQLLTERPSPLSICAVVARIATFDKEDFVYVDDGRAKLGRILTARGQCLGIVELALEGNDRAPN